MVTEIKNRCWREDRQGWDLIENIMGEFSRFMEMFYFCFRQ